MQKVTPNKRYLAVERLFKTIVYLLVALAAFSLLVFTAINILYLQVPVIGYSMNPTINSTVPSDDIEGDIMIVNRLLQGDVGDIIVVDTNWANGGEEIVVVKRLIAVEGDKVKFEKQNNGDIVLYKNGEILVEDYITSTQENEYIQWINFVNTNSSKIDSDGYMTIEDDEIFILGDNREASLDSSAMGTVSKSNIVGKVELIVEYQSSVIYEIFTNLLELFRI